MLSERVVKDLLASLSHARAESRLVPAICHCIAVPAYSIDNKSSCQQYTQQTFEVRLTICCIYWHVRSQDR